MGLCKRAANLVAVANAFHVESIFSNKLEHRHGLRRYYLSRVFVWVKVGSA